MTDFAIIQRIPTDRPDYNVKVALTYTKGKGYYASIVLMKTDNGMESSPLFGQATKRILLTPATRFSQKQFDVLRLTLTSDPNSYHAVKDAITQVLEVAPSQSW